MALCVKKPKRKITINAPTEKFGLLLKSMAICPGIPIFLTQQLRAAILKVRSAFDLKRRQHDYEELKKYDDAKMSYAYKITEMSSSKTITHAGAEEKVPALPVNDYAASIELADKGVRLKLSGKAVITALT